MTETHLHQFLELARQYFFDLMAPGAQPALMPVRIDNIQRSCH